MKKATLLLTAAVALVAAASGSAAPTKHLYQGKLGDSFAVGGTQLVCSVTRLNGKPGFSCGKVNGTHTVTGTYNVGITDEYAVIGRFTNTSGGNSPAASKHQPSLSGPGFGSASNGGTVRTLRPGDEVHVLGSHVLVDVGQNSTAGVFVTAVLTKPSTELIPGAYAVGISSKSAALSQVTSTGGDQKVLVLKRNPS
jgi:hypothetical protein